MSDDTENRKIVGAIRASHERDFDRDVCVQCNDPWPCDVERLAFIADEYMDEGQVTQLTQDLAVANAKIEEARGWADEVVKVTNANLVAHGVCYCEGCVGNIERQRASNEVRAILSRDTQEGKNG